MQQARRCSPLVRGALPMRPASLLQLLWLASPALPVGGFSYSEGLESAIDAGHVHDEASTATWLQQQLALSLARSELPLLVQALAAWHDDDSLRIAQLNDWQLQTRETSELRRQTEQMGRSMADWLAQRAWAETLPADTAGGAMVGMTLPVGSLASAEAPETLLAPVEPETPEAPEAGQADEPTSSCLQSRVSTLKALAPAPSWPVAFALAAWHAGASPRDAALSFGFAWAENMVQAALKAVPLGQNAGQRVLATLAAALPAWVDAALQMPDGQRQSFLPMAAILSAQHESQYSRLFRS